MTSIRDRLHGVLARGTDDDPVDESGQDGASGGDHADRVRITQPVDQPPVAPPTPSHIPDAALGFDPWGLRESSSWDSPGATRRWVETLLGSHRHE